MNPHNKSLIGFFSKQVPMEDIMRLRVTLGTWPLVVNINIGLLIVNAPNNTYNAILGKISLNKAKVIILILYLLMKFLMPREIN